jgi:polyphosphate kinase
MQIEANLEIDGRVYTRTIIIQDSTIDDSRKKRMEESFKEDIFQMLYESILDQCNEWEWSHNQSHKLKNKIEKTKIDWTFNN